MEILEQILEIDLPRCTRTPGVAPCGAPPVNTGSCFNSAATCQYPDAYNGDSNVFVFRARNNTLQPGQSITVASGMQPAPVLKRYSYSGQRLFPGERLPAVETVTITLEDSRHNDTRLDPHLLAREYNPWEQGTLLGRLTARYPNLRGLSLRFSENGVTRHYKITKADYDGRQMEIQAAGVLGFLQGDDILFPPPTNGATESPLAASGALSFTITNPDQYAASGYAVIGDEIVQFTRSGATMTVAAGGRARFNTALSAHEQGASVQQAHFFDGEFPADIIAHLLNFAGVPSSYIPMADWVLAMESAGLQYAITRLIAKPSPVRDILNSFIKSLALEVKEDSQQRLIYVDAVKLGVDSYTLDADLLESQALRQDYSRRRDRYYTHFDKSNPLEGDEFKYYNGHHITADIDQVRRMVNPEPAIDEYFDPWHIITQRQQVIDVQSVNISKNNKVLNVFDITVDNDFVPPLGAQGIVRSQLAQDSFGQLRDVRCKVVEIRPAVRKSRLVCEEFDAVNRVTNIRTVTVGPGAYTGDPRVVGINLRDLHDSAWSSSLPTGTTVVFLPLFPDVYVASADDTNPIREQFSLVSGSWPGGVTVIVRGLNVYGRRGLPVVPVGNGQGAGQPGGSAVLLTTPVTFEDCGIYAGGGAGGSTRGEPVTNPGRAKFFTTGGQGAGARGGLSPAIVDATPGTTNRGVFAPGGGLGQEGTPSLGPGPGQVGFGGLAGWAISGHSLATLVNCTVLGPTTG